ncbi:alpha/beta hydrolase family protein [Nafulsella turpanensis]|uniref:alpha/beta hydrolase family protein n=1 Tax=Nafulsella turpanensis TaxID=1265690 RepID=UPI00034BD0D5|nr:alpha/beta fold hydrolase [Nafulsella turpanensis]
MEKLQFIPNTRLHSPHGRRPFIYDARFLPNGVAKPVIIFIHGFKGFKDWGHFNLIADSFAQEGFVYIKLNLSHNGTTPEKPMDFADLEAFGQNNFSIELDDLDTLLDHLEKGESAIPAGEMDFSRLSLIGHSRGGGLAMLKTAEDPRVKACVSWAGIHDLSKRWPEEFIEDWRKKGVQYIYNSRTNQQMPLYFQLAEDFTDNKERLDIPTAVANMEQPLLLIHGTADETLPYQMAEEMKRWKPDAELFLVENANHTFGAKHPYENSVLPPDSQIVARRTLEFLKKVI